MFVKFVKFVNAQRLRLTSEIQNPSFLSLTGRFSSFILYALELLALPLSWVYSQK